jgi:hypothetical protein
MVTGNADREGVESRKDRMGVGRWSQDTSRQQILVRHGQRKGPPRDHRPDRASHKDCVVTKEIRQLAWREPRTRETKCKKRGSGQ